MKWDIQQQSFRYLLFFIIIYLGYIKRQLTPILYGLVQNWPRDQFVELDTSSDNISRCVALYNWIVHKATRCKYPTDKDSFIYNGQKRQYSI